MSGIFTVFGVADGRMQFSDREKNAAIHPIFYFDYTQVDRARTALIAAVETMSLAATDWIYREDDEKDLVLSELARTGAELIDALAGQSSPAALKVILNSVTHLVCETDRHIPWEFLYLGALNSPTEVTDFFGYRAVVGRPFYQSYERSRGRALPGLTERGPLVELPASARLTIGYAEDNRLASARTGAEISIFEPCGLVAQRLKHLVPNTILSGEELNEFLSASSILTHFNSHAVCDDPRKRTRAAIFVSDSFAIGKIDIDALEICENSIIVLNCCNGHTMRHDVEETLAMRFMTKRVSAVVATTAAIEDDYATQWAKHFYSSLARGEVVPRSILDARKVMLVGSRPNPSALLYTYFGSEAARLPRKLGLAA